MSRRMTLLWAILCMTVFAASSALGFEVNPEIEQFERALESRLQERIRMVYGEDARVAISVRALADSRASKAAAQGGEDKVLYAPFPVDLQGDELKLSFSSLEITLQVPEGVDSKFVEGLQTLVKNAVKESYAPRITVLKIPSANPAATGISAPGEGESNWGQKLISQVGVLGAALFLSIAILILGNGLKSSVTAIAEGMRIQAATSANVTLNGKGIDVGGSMELKNGGRAPGTGMEGFEPSGALSVLSVQAYGRNIEVIQRLLKEEPFLISQVIEDSDSESVGIKSLLPSLTAEDQQRLGACLGRSRMAKVAAVSTVHPSPSAWLRQLVERILARKLQGGNSSEKILGSEKARTFALADHNALVTAAASINTGAAWRIALDFLPKEHVPGVLAKLEETQWDSVASSAGATPEEILQTGTEMHAILASAPQRDLGLVEREEYLRNTLLNPVAEVVSGKDPREADAFVEKLSYSSPELSKLIKGKVWTISRLALVPDSELIQAFQRLTHEDKALLLMVLPETEAKRLEAGFSKGNVRMIVMDRVRMLRGRELDSDKRQAADVVKRYLEYLRARAETQAFVLHEPMGVREAA